MDGQQVEDEGVGHDCNHEDQEDHGDDDGDEDEDEGDGGEATVGHDPDTS